MPQKSAHSDELETFDDSEALDVISEASEGDFGGGMDIVRSDCDSGGMMVQCPSSPSDLVFELTPEAIEAARSQIVSFGIDPVTASLCQAILDYCPVDQWAEMPAQLATLAALKKSGRLPGWWDDLVRVWLDSNQLQSLNKVCTQIGINKWTPSSFAHTHGLQRLLHVLRQANYEQSVNSLEDELHDRASDRADKGSIPFLIFALKGGRPWRYKESAQIAVQVNNGTPAQWAIDPTIRQ